MISFDVKNISWPDIDVRKVDIWLREIASRYNRKIGHLNYLFCDDEEILRVNREFLQHDYYTDIITFDYSFKERVSGDLFISIDTVKTNAEELNVPFQQELLRVIVHGLLHLCGIDDKGPGEREIMEEHEDSALKLYASMK